MVPVYDTHERRKLFFIYSMEVMINSSMSCLSLNRLQKVWWSDVKQEFEQKFSVIEQKTLMVGRKQSKILNCFQIFFFRTMIMKCHTFRYYCQKTKTVGKTTKKWAFKETKYLLHSRFIIVGLCFELLLRLAYSIHLAYGKRFLTFVAIELSAGEVTFLDFASGTKRSSK